ncbi:Reverse transcriptase (RNA-dependent DNA polymerase) [Popillia japonica]|uniref:Reverse transcriptase (RNA-dependent DNA polymerase) n=1 Tax=Popillia japonica TaxID=7064 RepID=A0AAW1JFU3_POPJA
MKIKVVIEADDEASLVVVTVSDPGWVVEASVTCSGRGPAHWPFVGRAYFPREWTESITVPIIKTGKENSEDVSKYQPISWINVGGKVLEKLLINRIMAYMYANKFMSRNQFGFAPKRGTTEAIMELKEFTEDSLRRGDVVVMVSLDVKGAFNAAWRPAILKSLKDSKCPKNLQLAGVKIEEKVSRSCPQESCCGPGFLNIQYNSLLKLNYWRNTKIIAFADDVVILTKEKTVLEAENRVNVVLDKVMEWANNNKINFNESKSQLMLGKDRYCGGKLMYS